MKIHLLAAGAMLASLAVASPAAAQPDTSADPIAGTVNLRAGFTPDPRVVAVRAGGSEAASSVGGNCQGFISSAPDVRLNYQSGSFPLIISVASNADTTLVINAPDGSWHCDDDGGVRGSNPGLRFNRPLTGAYEIWIGTYRSGGTQAARLHISETSSQ